MSRTTANGQREASAADHSPRRRAFSVTCENGSRRSANSRNQGTASTSDATTTPVHRPGPPQLWPPQLWPRVRAVLLPALAKMAMLRYDPATHLDQA